MKAKSQHEAKARAPHLTLPDLLLLSLLAERPMHGYQANAELERRQVREWAGISRPQIYYSLEKLARSGLLRGAHDAHPAAGPERRVFHTTEAGRRAVADALERADWATQRDHPPFVAFVALSWQARRGVFEAQIARRSEYLRQQLAHARNTQRAILKETGHRYHEAYWAVSLSVAQFEAELRWLRTLERELPKRAKARHPAYAASGNSGANRRAGVRGRGNLQPL